MTPIGLAILELLKQRQVPHQRVSHPPAATCELSAELRNLPMELGGKSLLFKGKQGFAMVVLPAHAQVDSSKVRRLLKSQKLRFAKAQELMEVAGVEKGALPPFGNGLLDIPMYLDSSLQHNPQIAFNCGVNTESVILIMSDYLSLVEVMWCECRKLFS